MRDDPAVVALVTAAVEQDILRAVLNAGLRAAPMSCRHGHLGVAAGSIGPQRARCLDCLRRSSFLVALGADDVDWPGGRVHAERLG
jgi:hypothetical protein